MSGGARNILLFEQQQRGDLWRLQLSTYKGRTAIDWRKWYSDDEGVEHATRQGVTISLERQLDLSAAIIRACQPEKASDGPPAVS